jgi:hypothetical protein
VLIELFHIDTLLVKPTVEMADEAELDSAVDARKAVGRQPVGKQIDVTAKGPCRNDGWCMNG